MVDMDTLALVRKHFTVDEYQQIADAGVFNEDDRFELLKGEIIQMSPLGPQHAACVDRLNRILQRLVQDRAIVRVQNPIRLGEYSQPQPDVTLVQPRDDFYAGGHPEPEDILLLVEVSEPSLNYDRDVKLPLYAQAGISEVWLVALHPQVVEVYRAPSEYGFGEKQTFRRGETVAPLLLPEAGLAVDVMLS